MLRDFAIFLHANVPYAETTVPLAFALIVVLLIRGIAKWLTHVPDKKKEVKENPNKINTTLEDAGFCLKCGHDSLWATVTRYQGKEERTLQCSYCDPSLQPEFRSTRSDRIMDDIQ